MKTIKKASLLFASLALVLGAGLVGNSDTKEVKAETKELVVDGNSLPSDITNGDTEFTIDGITYVFSKGAKSQSSSGSNRFTENAAILIGKKGAYIYNKTPLGEKINSFQIYANGTASKKVTVGLSFDSSPISSSQSKYDYAGALSSTDKVYDITSSLPENAQYFRYQVTNAYNSQIQFKIGIEEAASKTIKSLTQSGTLKKTAYQVGEAFDPNGLTITANYDDGTSEDVTSKVTWPAITSGMTSIVGSFNGKTIEITGISILEYTLSINANKVEMVKEDEGEFSYSFKNANGDIVTDVTAELIEWKSSNDAVLLIDENTGYWIAAGNGVADVALHIIDSQYNSYTAKTSVLVTDHHGSMTDPYSVADAIIKAKQTGTTATTDKYYIKGIICDYTPNAGNVSKYGNVIFSISDDGVNENTFLAFQVNYLGGNKFTSSDQVAIGDAVVIYGNIVNYQGTTPETTGYGAAYVYSHTKAADLFVAKVKAFDLCNASAEELKAMLDEYDALIAKNADAANSVVDETTTLAERMAYMQLIYNKKANTTGDSTSGVVITSNNSYDKTSLIALFAILGIVTISGYYIIEKKKFSK